MNFTLQQLAIFHDLCQTRSVTQTAENLHLTQPAVSIQLKNIQKQFDRPLFETIGKRIYITDWGLEILHHVQNLMHEAENIQQLTKTPNQGPKGQLKIAVVSTGKYVMPFFLTDFLAKNPNIELQMDVSNKQQVLDRLKNNEIDFALVSILPEQLTLKKMDLLENKLQMVGPASAKAKTLQDCTPLIYREFGSGTRQSMEKYLSKRKVHPSKTLELTSNEAIKQAVIAGMGYSIMPLIGLKNELINKEIKIIPLPGLPIKTTWKLVWRAEKKLSVTAEAYLVHLRKSKEEIQKKYF
jgi:DNA-binding transcriptional LysR family regulator